MSAKFGPNSAEVEQNWSSAGRSAAGTRAACERHSGGTQAAHGRSVRGAGTERFYWRGGDQSCAQYSSGCLRRRRRNMPGFRPAPRASSIFAGRTKSLTRATRIRARLGVKGASEREKSLASALPCRAARRCLSLRFSACQTRDGVFACATGGVGKRLGGVSLGNFSKGGRSGRSTGGEVRSAGRPETRSEVCVQGSNSDENYWLGALNIGRSRATPHGPSLCAQQG